MRGLVFSTLAGLALSASLGCATAPPQPKAGKHAEAAIASTPPVSPSASPKLARSVDEPLTRPDAHHLLSRFTFGPTLRELQSIEQSSAMDWLAWQLEPEAIDDTALE